MAELGDAEKIELAELASKIAQATRVLDSLLTERRAVYLKLEARGINTRAIAAVFGVSQPAVVYVLQKARGARGRRADPPG